MALKSASEKAGIADKMIISFGTLLGAIRDRGIIPHDTDMDVCFLPLTIKEKENYYQICHKRGLFNGWNKLIKRTSGGFEKTDRISRVDNSDESEITWFSTKIDEEETKCCNWFLTEWNNIIWHHKGLFWQKQGRPYLKGAPKECFEDIQKIEFLGEEFNSPIKAGSILDFWYPNWMVPKYEGESCHDIICTYDNYFDKKTWRME